MKPLFTAFSSTVRKHIHKWVKTFQIGKTFGDKPFPKIKTFRIRDLLLKPSMNPINRKITTKVYVLLHHLNSQISPLPLKMYEVPDFPTFRTSETQRLLTKWPL